MNGLVSFIDKYGVSVILVFGVAVLFGLIFIGVRLKKVYDKLKDGRITGEIRISANTPPEKAKEMLEKLQKESNTNGRESIKEVKSIFNSLCVWHTICAVSISIFPLLGVLGTVAGLILSVNAEGSDVLNSLDVALETTFYGLLFAIILKFIDTLCPSMLIDRIDVAIDKIESDNEGSV
ncbi:MAG: MotA/TolQ/ExbB proton channel family protein [Oscillospiraceae bacterium]|nr:MotA/TolQ/ExbB proton channel family protein [Oscillospiraceae bacterium]